MPQEIEIFASAATNTGLLREHNEDSYLAEFPVFVVADGMGGHEAGDLASQAVISTFKALSGRDDLEPSSVLPVAQATHEEVARATQSDNAGSTLTGVIAVTVNAVRHWMVLNLGDSRVYKLSGGSLQQVTKDHSLLQDLLDSGELQADQADSFVAKNVITKAVGDGGSEVDHLLLPMLPSERLLVCSDGLHGEISDEMILSGMRDQEKPSDAVRWLITKALESGGRDNITAIVVDVRDATHFEHSIDTQTVPSLRRGDQ